MNRPRAHLVTLPLSFLLLTAALVLGAVTGVRPVAYGLMAAGALSVLATAVILARRPDVPPAPAAGDAAPSPGEGDLERAERLAAVGRLAAGVAHEVNNPLTGALTYAHLLAARKDLPADVVRDLELIIKATERVREIVKRLLDFARETELARAATDLNDLVTQTLALVRRQAEDKGVELAFEGDTGLPAAVMDASQMQSVILNLVLNALDATPRGGRIRVATRAATSEPTDATYPRTGIEMTVTDTGTGIPSEHLERLFDPFFTTKDPGSGTGLGLSVSHTVVERHGGEIRVRSTPGEGSTFLVWIPTDEGR